MEMDQIVDIVRASFPTEPLPVRRFWLDGEKPDVSDIPDEIEKRLAMRPWNDVTIDDWRMIGTVGAARSYLDPNAYRYYLPSLLLGGVADTGEFIEYALEAILPTSWRRRTTGKWWQEFAAGFSVEQRMAIQVFLSGVRERLWNFIGPANQQYVVEAEAIWNAAGEECRR